MNGILGGGLEPNHVPVMQVFIVMETRPVSRYQKDMFLLDNFPTISSQVLEVFCRFNFHLRLSFYDLATLISLFFWLSLTGGKKMWWFFSEIQNTIPKVLSWFHTSLAFDWKILIWSEIVILLVWNMWDRSAQILWCHENKTCELNHLT